jgi:predicted TIM-barrel fold metal-dependent hydrolase
MSQANATAEPTNRPPDCNRTGIDFHMPMPRLKVKGIVIDFHSHLLANRHGPVWFETAAHFGIDCFVTMSPLEEAVGMLRDHPGRIHFIAVPRWQDATPDYDDWMRRIEGFYNLGSRMVKFHMSPGTLDRWKWRLDSPTMRPILREVTSRGMAIMTHVGDPETWYQGKYTDHSRYGTREEHYQMWESVMREYPNTPWVGAHLGGNPENLGRLQRLLDTYPNLSLDCSATRWMVREISNQRDQAREFFIRNAGRIIFGSDQVSGDDRGFDFLASRFWAHRKLWETAYIGPSPIVDPDLPQDQQPTLRGLALPDSVLQSIYHDNAVRFLDRLGLRFELPPMPQTKAG